MASLNRVMVIGRLGRDGELQYNANGNPRISFSVAVDERRKTPAGEWETYAEWFNVILMGDRAETLAQYLLKGKMVYVEGRLSTRSWEKDGEKHYRTEVIARDIQLLSPRDADLQQPRAAREPREDLPFED